MIPIWAYFYMGFILFGGMGSIYNYRNKGAVFIVGESFSLLFSIMMILYYFNAYPLPDSYLIPLGMLGFVVIWEWIINFEIFKNEIEKEVENKTEMLIFVLIAFLAFVPIVYMGGIVISKMI
jgi:hypothetical protein